KTGLLSRFPHPLVPVVFLPTEKRSRSTLAPLDHLRLLPLTHDEVSGYTTFLFLLHLWQAAPQDVVHGDGLDRPLHHTGGGVIHQIGRDTERLRQQLIDTS